MQISYISFNFCPLIWTSLTGSCLQQFLVWFLMIIFYFLLSIYSLEFFSKDVVLSTPISLLIQLSIYQYEFKHIDVLFRLQQSYRYFFCCLHFSQCFGHRELFQVGSFSLLKCTDSSFSKVRSLVSGTTAHSSLILDFPCPRPELNHLSREPGFPSLENDIYVHQENSLMLRCYCFHAFSEARTRKWMSMCVY